MVSSDCVCGNNTFESGKPACSGCSILCGTCIVSRYNCITCNEETDFRIINSS